MSSLHGLGPMAPLQESSRLELTIALAATTTYVETGSESKGAVVLQQELLCFPFSKKEKKLTDQLPGGAAVGCRFLSMRRPNI